MKQVILTFLISCVLAVPLAFAGGGQCQKSEKEQGSNDQPEEVSDAKENHKVTPVSKQEKVDNSSWITTLETSKATQQNTQTTDKDKKKVVNYSNYSFLFQLFYKYSLSDFFEAPSFRDEKKNNLDNWGLDLQEQKETAYEWLDYWGKKLYHNLKQ
jgi:hypothetical protein